MLHGDDNDNDDSDESSVKMNRDKDTLELLANVRNKMADLLLEYEKYQ